MKINFLTIFPDIFNSYISESILARAQKKGFVKFNSINIRNFSLDKHKKVDAKSYGGGSGMIMQIEPIFRALKSLQVIASSKRSEGRGNLKKKRIILLSAKGKLFKQSDAKRLSKYDELIFICGRYEGVDERITKFIDEEISIGEYVLTGGELPAIVIADSIIRLIPGVISEESLKEESFATKKSIDNQQLTINHYLEYPQYTRPEIFEYKNSKTKKIIKLKVPKVLTSGDHKKIEKWREKSSK